MEPMTLGSPSGSPAATAGNSPYLPSFLMGDTNSTATPRSNTLSPTKGRTISFATSPSNLTSPNYNKSHMESRALFSHQDSSGTGNIPGTPVHTHNTSVSGPPTQGLFDLLRAERTQVQTPIKQYSLNHSTNIGTPVLHPGLNQTVNDSYLSSASFNTSRIQSPQMNLNVTTDYRSNQNGTNTALGCPSPPPRYSDFWVTVFGFPQSATSMILSHFSQCGTIIDKIFPPQNGNWVHIKYSSRLECEKAYNYNEKILGNNIMIGVTHCKDASIVDKENLCENIQVSRVRPLSQTAYKSAQCDTAVVACPTAPQRSSGLVNKAMDLLFGW